MRPAKRPFYLRREMLNMAAEVSLHGDAEQMEFHMAPSTFIEFQRECGVAGIDGIVRQLAGHPIHADSACPPGAVYLANPRRMRGW